MSNGVKFPDILKHENENYAIVDSNDVRGFYITEQRWSDFQPISITEGRRKINYLVFAKGSLYQYYGNTVADSDWGQKSNWLQFGIADEGRPISTIHVYPNKEVIENQCLCEDEPFVACAETNRIYKFITDGTEFDGESSDVSIQTAQGEPTRYVDVVILNLSNSFLLRSANLSDVADRETALKNITASESANIGDILRVDENHNVVFKPMPSALNIKGRVDTVEDLPTDAEKGDVYLVGLEGSEEFSEYVCIDDTTIPCTWESLGPIAKEEIWKHGGTGFETSIRPTRQGYIDGEDSILLLVPESTAFSSNTIVAPDAIESEKSSNISIISCNNINIGNYNNYDALIASENIKLDGFSYSAFIANKTQITSTATQGSGSSGLLNYGDITYSLISANYSTDDLQHMRIKGKSLVIIGNEMSNSSVTYIGSDSESNSTLISSNVFNDQIRYDGSYTSFFNNIFEGNSYISAFRSILASNILGASGMGFYFNDSAIFASDIHSVGMYGSRSFITTSNISDGSTEDLSQSAIISSDISAFDLSGEKVGLLLTNASGFVMDGNNSLILTSYITAGSYKQSYSTVESSQITASGFGARLYNSGTAEYHKYFTISSISVISSLKICEDVDNELSSEFVSLSSININAVDIGYKREDDTYSFLKYASIDTSNIPYYNFSGSYNKISSSYFNGGRLDGDYISILSSYITGETTNGENNAIISAYLSGGYIRGDYNLISSSYVSGIGIDGNYNTILSSSGGVPNDKLGSYTAMIASELSTVPSEVTHSAAIAMQYGRLAIEESYTLYTNKIKSINAELLDNLTFTNGLSTISSTVNPLTISSIGAINMVADDITVNGSSILGKMAFCGEVEIYEDLPSDASVGDVYSIQEAVDVYNGLTPEELIGVYPPSTNFVKTENGYESLGGYISYITKERLDEICVLE